MNYFYQKKLKRYQEYMGYLNDHIYDTNKIINLIKYANDSGIINDKNIIYLELNAMYDFYIRDLIKSMNFAKNCEDEQIKKDYLDKADADLMLIDSISEDNHVKSNYLIINEYLNKVKKLERFIKDEDKITLKSINNNIKR